MIRNGIGINIKSDAVVMGDSMIIEEGTSIVADGAIVHSNDFSVNESILTGESFAVYKDQSSTDKRVFSGTTVAVLFVFQYVIARGYNKALTRSMVFAALLTANIILTLVNRSFYYSVITTLRYRNNLVLLITVVSVLILLMLLFLKPLNVFFTWSR